MLLIKLNNENIQINREKILPYKMMGNFSFYSIYTRLFILSKKEYLFSKEALIIKTKLSFFAL